MFKSAVDLPNENFWEEYFRCSFCKEILTIKIFYCEKGHFVCHACAKCECGAKATKLQANFLENIIRKTRFMCELDCGTLLSNDEYGYHVEDSCRCRPVPCPLCPESPTEPIIAYKDYIHHLQRLHNIERVDLKDGKCSVQITPNTPSIKYTMFENQTFFIRWLNNKFWIQSYERANKVMIDIEGVDFKCTLKPSRLHAEIYQADSVTLRMDDTIGITFSCIENGNNTKEYFRFSL